MQPITDDEIKALASANGYTFAALKAIITVESGGIGFSKETGKIIIQFEPTWFERLCKGWQQFENTGTWFHNGVATQEPEWKAFNDAFNIDPDAAMGATSIGMMQVMGFHWKSLGFSSVGEMWEYAKVSEANQVNLAIKFIKNNPKLDKALQNKDWPTVAFYYNGSSYKVYNYDHRLIAAHFKYSTTQTQNFS